MSEPQNADLRRPISYSRVNTYTYQCPHAYYLRYIAGIVNNNTSLNRVWGRAVHIAIQTWHEAAEQGDLKELIDATFAKELSVWPDLEEICDTIAGFLPEEQALVAKLAESYKVPRGTKAYQESEVAQKLGQLNQKAIDAAEGTTLRYTKREGIMARLMQHEDIAALYQVFNTTYPLLTINDRPAVEQDIVTTLGDIPFRAILDQIRIWPDGPYEGEVFPVDLKTNVEDLTEDLADTNYQLAHQQLVMTLSDDFPAPKGAGWYSLRTGQLIPVKPMSPDLLDEWMDNVQMVLRAEEHCIFPKRRDMTCLRCDYYQDHCQSNIGPVSPKDV